MKKLYTKKQIVEAIKYWEFVLKMMDESKSPLLDEFAKTFGENVLFSNKPNISITLENVKIIYDILNKNIFNNTLNIKTDLLDLYCDSCHIIRYSKVKGSRSRLPFFINSRSRRSLQLYNWWYSVQ